LNKPLRASWLRSGLNAFSFFWPELALLQFASIAGAGPDASLGC
jgi:hypothetical protein